VCLKLWGASASATPSSVSSLSKNAASANPTPGTPAPKASPSQKDGVHPRHETKARPQLPAGTYNVKNVGSEDYLTEPTKTPPLDSDGSLVSLVMLCKQRQSSLICNEQFTLTYTGTSNGELTLGYDEAQLVSSGTFVSGGMGMWQWNKWVLEGHTDPIDGCYY
jgi:hypothetical protein